MLNKSNFLFYTRKTISYSTLTLIVFYVCFLLFKGFASYDKMRVKQPSMEKSPNVCGKVLCPHITCNEQNTGCRTFQTPVECKKACHHPMCKFANKLVFENLDTGTNTTLTHVYFCGLTKPEIETEKKGYLDNMKDKLEEQKRIMLEQQQQYRQYAAIENIQIMLTLLCLLLVIIFVLRQFLSKQRVIKLQKDHLLVE